MPFVAATKDDVRRACDMAAQSLSRVQPSTLQNFFAKKPRIILGSGSSSRRQLVNQTAKEHSFEFEVQKADIDEKALPRQNTDPSALVLTLGRYKAASIYKSLTETNNKEDLRNSYLVTGDQVVIFQGCIREKPEDAEQARRFIQSYSGSSARTIGSCVCTCIEGGNFNEGIDVAEVYFKQFPADLADKLVDEGSCFNCAGGLMVEHPLVAPYIEKIVGGMDSIMGLSQQTMLRLLIMSAQPAPVLDKVSQKQTGR